jgi:hypothetical protein
MHEVQLATNDQWHIGQEIRRCIDTLCVVISRVSFTTSRISSSTSGFVDLGRPRWQHEVQNSHVHKGGDGYVQMFSYLDIFVLGTFLGTNRETPQHYRPPNAYRLTHQLSITTHLTHNYCTLLLRFRNCERSCSTDTTIVLML